MVHTQYKQIFDDKMEFDYSTVEVLHSEWDIVYIEVEATLVSTEADEDGSYPEQREKILIGMIEESDGWRIHTSTFANYNKYKDKLSENND